MTKLLFIALLFVSITSKAQTNTFPSDGNVGIGTTSPIEKLDLRGNIYLRNMANLIGGGTSINFSSYDDVHLGPKIYSYLDYANGSSSVSRLVLSSYYGGYPNELTLIGGNVGIGTMTPSDKLSVNGNIRAKEVKVETANWPDYVFEKDYNLSSLASLEAYILKNKHLPNIPSATDIANQGQNLGELNAKLLKTVEELTLHLIQKDKQLTLQETRQQIQDKRIKKMEQMLKEILDKRSNP